MGIEGLIQIVGLSKLPVVAIGDINKDNIAAVAQTKAAMAAVISGLIDNGTFMGQELHESFLKEAS